MKMVRRSGIPPLVEVFLYLPPLGTVLRQPGKAPVRLTDPFVAELPVQRRLAPDEVAKLVASYQAGAP